MNYFKLTAFLTKLECFESEILYYEKALDVLSKDDFKQNKFLNYCIKWKVAPWVYLQLLNKNLLSKFNKNTRFEFERQHLKIKIENEERNKIAYDLINNLLKNNIRVIILKGSLFSKTVYQNDGYKKMNDFDLLINKNDWNQMQEILFNLGFFPLGFGWGGEKQKPTKYSHTAIPFISKDFKCIIGTQWSLKSPTTKHKINIKEIWNTAQPFDFNGLQCKQLSAEYNLLHLILHLGVYKCGIRDCMDIYNLMQSHTINHSKLNELLISTNALEKAKFAFEMSNLCSNINGELLVTNQFNRGFLLRRLNKRIALHKETGDFQLSYNDYFQDIEKNVLFLSVFPKFHKRLPYFINLLKLIFFPTSNICLKFIDKPHQPSFINKLKGRISAPYFTFSLISQEIGKPFTFLLFFKLCFDIAISPINYFIKKESYFDYLNRIKIDANQIKKIVNNVQ